MREVLSFADMKTSEADIISDLVAGKELEHEKSGLKLETLSTSSTCFQGQCTSTTIESALCPVGTYVYQITGYSGSNLGTYPYATKFDIFCSDGSNATIGQTGTFTSSSTTIINPQGYTAVLAAGGCITDHILIGGTDFGSAGYGPLSTCSCGSGLTFVGFKNLQYDEYWPSFPYINIECDVACPKGTYYSGGICYPCLPGIIQDFSHLNYYKNRNLLFPGLYRLQP